MMKCVFSLVVLLHLCSTIAFNLNLNKEIIYSLEDLTNLYREGLLNITSPDTVKVPSMKMCRHADCCVEVFKKELQTLLSDRVVHNNNSEVMDTLWALDNLELLQQEHKAGHCNMTNCTMINNREPPLRVFKWYIHFLKKLNTSNSNTPTRTFQ